ncbi:uncharacterized protein LTR77_005971 [Saxophila tyrrhenica]|uniref:F-box domain-containing protein n=1 Tax=Saxophila tyrrhenica TaxID=1690608 RepID=A0AAV9PAJ8_9PEZI|nr:hypothetical protein LTR77_005971 [Saxophila tyrrhenica]
MSPFGWPSDRPIGPTSDLTSSRRHSNQFSNTTFAPDLGILDRYWIFEHLSSLNDNTEPVLNENALTQITLDVARQLSGLVGRPVDEAYDEAQPVLLESLFLAKHGSLQNSTVNMSTPLLGQFLVAINGFIDVRNENGLAEYLVLEPPFGDHYMRMIEELKSAYPRGSENALEEKCSQNLKAAREGAEDQPWTPFIKFMVQYLGYLRDVDADPNKYLQTYELLSELQVRANSALAHGVLGYLILRIVVANAKLVCRLAIGLDKQPELIRNLKSAGGQQGGGEDDDSQETLPERAANILRRSFVTCLNDRSQVKDGKPGGRKKGIYIIANLCLKILFQCRKTRNATQIFENIYNLSPPLNAYPKRERVTYLYYLGRFLFQNSHFYRAQQALQHAYDESPSRQECVRQRRHILVYLIASNTILGRFPSEALLSRPEAQGLADRFLPICFAIRKGDLASFRQHLDFDSPHADWFLHFRILLQLRNRCEVLVWRSLVRKTWILNGTRPTDASSKVAPTVNIHDLVAAFTFLENRSTSQPDNYTDPDFAGITYDNPDDPSVDGSSHYDTTSMESILSSLIDQGLLGGYFSHRLMKFAITGAAKKGSALAAGFPQPWGVLQARAEREDGEVPGWKKEVKMGTGGAMRPGPGMVLNLSGARPVGVAGLLQELPGLYNALEVLNLHHRFCDSSHEQVSGGAIIMESNAPDVRSISRAHQADSASAPADSVVLAPLPTTSDADPSAAHPPLAPEHDQTTAERSAGQRLSDTVELLEMILFGLPMKDLLFSQKVCKQWNEVIESSTKLQQALFFKAPPGDQIGDQLEDSEGPFSVNPLVCTMLRSWGRTSYPLTRSTPRSFLLPHEWREVDSSWRKMDVTSPPTCVTIKMGIRAACGHGYDIREQVTKDLLTGWHASFVYDHNYSPYGSISKSMTIDTSRMGDVYEVMQEELDVVAAMPPNPDLLLTHYHLEVELTGVRDF